MKCQRCKPLGSHHTALCEFQSTNGKANFVSRDTTILLQTADLKIVDNKNYHYVAKVLSDSCSGNLDKYQYLTGENLNYKPSTVEQVKFDYSSFRQLFNKGLKVEDKNKEQLKAIKDQRKK